MAFEIRGRCALITGAANGIGRALALELAERRADLVLVDRDACVLEQLEAVLHTQGHRVLALACDLADGDAIAALPEAAALAGFSPDCLVNNAGIGSMGLFSELALEEIERVFTINFWGALRMTHAFLPTLMAKPRGRIVNVSSVLGIIAAPDQSPYVASKFALRGFSEALAMELTGSGVGVSVVYPGGVATSITDRATVAARLDSGYARQQLERYSRSLKLPPERAAQIIADGIEHEKSRILIGREARLMDKLQRLMPAAYMRLLAGLLSRKGGADARADIGDG